MSPWYHADAWFHIFCCDTLLHPQVFPEAEKHRTEADHQAKLRGEKLGESQAAYQAGHKANAHEFSVEVSAE